MKESEIIKVAGLAFIQSNNMVSENITTNKERYNGDFSNTVAVVATDESVGMVSRVDMITTSGWLPEHKPHLLTAEHLVGHDYFHPECAMEPAFV